VQKGKEEERIKGNSLHLFFVLQILKLLFIALLFV